MYSSNNIYVNIDSCLCVENSSLAVPHKGLAVLVHNSVDHLDAEDGRLHPLPVLVMLHAFKMVLG